MWAEHRTDNRKTNMGNTKLPITSHADDLGSDTKSRWSCLSGIYAREFTTVYELEF